MGNRTLSVSAELYERIRKLAARDKTGTVVRGGIKDVADRIILAALEAEERKN